MTQAWTIATGALLPALTLVLVALARGPAAGRLVALTMATSLAILMLVALSFAIDQASSIDLALTLALLSLPGALIFAEFEERWL
jgi:multisubunit Na+/H+ antiporter MnhF subunit